MNKQPASAMRLLSSARSVAYALGFALQALRRLLAAPATKARARFGAHLRGISALAACRALSRVAVSALVTSRALGVGGASICLSAGGILFAGEAAS
jgi:hypothetical protein